MNVATEQPKAPGPAVLAARRRAGLAAAVAGLLLIPWFVVTDAVAGLDPPMPPLGAPDQEFVAAYVANYERIPWNVTLLVGQWVILLVLLVAMVRAVCVRLDLAALAAVGLATAATAIYVAAEGLLLWPALPESDVTAATLADRLDADLAKAALLPRDGLHACAAILVGCSVLVVAWLMLRSDAWGHWAMAVVGGVAGVLALTSAVVGPEGLGPGLVLVVWAPLVSILLLVGRRRARAPGRAPTA